MRAELVAATALRSNTACEATDAEAVIAHAAMASHDAETVLRRLIDDDRTDLLTHASATLHLYGVSRAAAETIRTHRGFSVSMRIDDAAVVPHLVAEDEDFSLRLAISNEVCCAVDHAVRLVQGRHSR